MCRKQPELPKNFAENDFKHIFYTEKSVVLSISVFLWFAREKYMCAYVCVCVSTVFLQ